MPNGKFYAVSTGPGNPDQITVEALQILKECDVIFYPESKHNTIALDVISKHLEHELSQKQLISCQFSMSESKEKSDAEYKKITDECVKLLKDGKSVAMLSIGDVSLYSTAAKTSAFIQKEGFDVKYISGVNSFSTAACSANLSLCKNDEKLTVIPGDSFYTSGKLNSALLDEGSKVLMKMGQYLKEIISLLNENSLIQNSTLIQKAGFPGEKIFRGKEILQMSEEDFVNSYLCVILVKT